MKEKKKFGEFFIYEYCLMNNHFHIVIKQGQDELARIMKRINTTKERAIKDFVEYTKKFDSTEHIDNNEPMSKEQKKEK